MLNLKYYSGDDAYSDGDIEDEILDISNSQKEIDKVLANDNRWPFFYHLSPARQNILSWYDFKPSANLLEIGAGCGAITPLFCERLSSVTAVELSRRRASIIDARCQMFKNLEIIAGNFKDIVFDKKFDYITMIGVLEYAESYINSKRPFHAFIERSRELLLPHGTLLIAIENQFGLKYWAGANEDHLAEPFVGLEGYPYDTHVRTFGKTELERLLKESGISDINFYYPYPDYKFPEAIYTDERLPSLSELSGFSPAYDKDRLALFNEAKVFEQLINNNQFSFFSNSFLVECKL